MKRFQDSSRLIKIWRYRWYLLIPFRWVYHMFNGFSNIDMSYKNGKLVINRKPSFIWNMCKSTAQIKMNWLYDSDEVFHEIKKRREAI